MSSGSQPVGGPSSSGSAAQASLERERRVIDQMLSMHATLGDRARVVSTTIRVALLCLSVVGVAFAFAGPDGPVTLLGVTAARSAWLGWLSVLVLAGTLTDLVTDRRTTARQHTEAASALGALKLAYRAASTGGPAVTPQTVNEQYRSIVDGLPAIPERQFNRLKAAHLRKIEISKLLSQHPGLSQRTARRYVEQAAKAALQEKSAIASKAAGNTVGPS